MKKLASTVLALTPALFGWMAFAPQAEDDIVDTAIAAGSFKTLAAAVTEAGLLETLRGDGPFTVFAPTDEAFAKLPEGTVEELLKPENREKLVSILTYHVVPGRVEAKDALIAENAATVQGESLRFRVDSGMVKVNDSTVVQNDIQCSNGVIHVIDSVLLPPEPPQPDVNKIIGIYPAKPSKAQRELLGLENGEGYLISSLVKNSGAAEAGLQSHDVIVAINGSRAVQGSLDEAKAQTDVGDFIEVVIARTVKVRVGVEDH